MRIIGIDPGVGRVGYGVVEADGDRWRAIAYGVIATEPGRRPADRLLAIAEALEALLRQTDPQAAAVERLFFKANVTTAMAVSEARGVILLVLGRRGLNVAEYTPAEVKQAIAGNGRAGKGQMQAMVRLLLGLPAPPAPDDAADALALALAHGQRFRFDRRIAAGGWGEEAARRV
ncbi:MAG: crossover junction endodeoxyribonuclease RuvC [Hydrogenibacillus schlegelii]|nr:crossover junction endodeoxyribonuclease RuvC [Hydrogenibacillus schlegelii]